MQMNKVILTCAALLMGTALFAQQPNLVKYVNTRQGTNSKYEFSYGNTYPATALPFWHEHLDGPNRKKWRWLEIPVFRAFHSWISAVASMQLVGK